MYVVVCVEMREYRELSGTGGAQRGLKARRVDAPKGQGGSWVGMMSAKNLF